MQGSKTHEQQLRILERKADVPDRRRTNAGQEQSGGHPPRHAARESEFAVSRGGLNQESRGHNKHNNPGQAGHRPQKHGPAEEKQ